MYALEWLPQPATPHVEIFIMANPAMYAAFGRAPYSQLPPEDVAMLAADPALRSRYCELCVSIMLPAYRRLHGILATKCHLNESLPPERLDSVLPGVGRGFKSLLGTMTAVYYDNQMRAAQFESLAARWAEERFDLLQPNWASSHIVLMMMVNEMIKVVGAKELQLVGVSSGSRTVAGGLDFAKGGAIDAKEADT
jgi:hypothetical protein